MNKTNDGNELPSLFAFPKGETEWRLDWLGDVSYPDRSSRRTQPSVFVHLSPVINSRASERPELFLSASTTDCFRQSGRWISVGALPLLQVGSIWRDGKRIAQPDYQVETFPALFINSSTTTLIKSGVAKGDANFLLPLNEHPWHRRCTHSYCLEVELEDGRRILIPCWELIRFYFGSSSGLVKSLLMPPLLREKLYTQANFDQAKGKLEITLAPGISGISAADIGRLHLSAHAWRAALQIGTSLLNSANSEHGRYPQTMIPFEGTTTLVASGKWLSHGGRAKATFVVFSLRSCSHQFPFRSLEYHSSGGTRNSSAQGPSDSPTGSKSNPEQKSTHYNAAGDARNQPLVERDPSNKLTPHKKRFQSNRRFPDLERKFVWKAKKLDEGIGLAKIFVGAAQAVKHAAVGSSASERRVRPVSLEAATANREPPLFLQPVLARIRKQGGATISVASASEHDGWSVPVELHHDSDGEIDPKLFINVPDGVTRPRRVCILVVNKVIRLQLVCVVEDAPALEIRQHFFYQKSFNVHAAVNQATNLFLESRHQSKPVGKGVLQRIWDGLLKRF